MVRCVITFLFQVVIDLKKDKAVFLAAIGGAGGHGNRFYKSNEVRVPLKAELGACGEEVSFFLVSFCFLIAFNP